MSAPASPGESTPLTLANRYYDAFNARDFDAWLDTLDQNVEVLVDAGVLRGRDAALGYLNGILQAYPGIVVSSRRVVAVSSDAVVSEFQLTNPKASIAAHLADTAEPAVPWRLDGVTCEVLRLRGDRLISLHSYYSPSATDRTPTAEVPSRAEAARIAHRQAALARVATQVAGGGSEQDLVAVINQVIAEFAGVDVSLIMRFETGDTAVLLAVSESAGGPAALGQRLVLREDIRAVRDSGRALRFGADGWPMHGPGAGGARRNGLRWCVGVPIMLHGSVWGVSLLGSTRDRPLSDDIEDGIAAFAQLVSTALSNAQANDELRERAREKSELLGVAEIAAAGAGPVEVFAAVVRSASAVLDGQPATLIRFVDDDVADVLAFSGAGIPPGGERLVIDPGSVTAQVMRTGRPARIENYRDAPGNRFANEVAGLHASAGVPIAVDGQLWGMLAATSMDGPLPPDIEGRLSQFTGTVATSVAGAQARAELRALADEQAALRRVAELIARGAEESQIYHAVSVEAAGIINEATTLIRLDQADSYTVVGSSSDATAIGTGIDIAPDDEGLIPQIVRTRLPGRVESLTESSPERPGDHFLHGLTSSVGVPILVGDRLWGVLSAAATGRRLLTTAEQSLQQFGGLMAAAVANAEARGRLKDFADEQVALRRVAELAAHDAPTEQVLQAVAVEASGLAGVEFGMVLQYEGLDGANRIVALNGAPDTFAVGMRAPGAGDSSVRRVWRTGRVTRVDDLGQMSGRWPRMAYERGFKASAGVPIVIHGALWGALIVCGRGGPVPRNVEEHLSNFAELAATAISAAHARQELSMLADEQAALRRIAELAAREAPAEEILQAVTVEASALAGVDFSTLLHYEPDGSTVIVALAGAPNGITVGMRSPGTGDGATQRVWRTGKPARIDNLAEMSGVWPQLAHRHGFNTSAAVPVVIHGILRGALVVVGRRQAFAHTIEKHLSDFADLAATALSAADARQSLRLLADEQAAVRRVAELVARSEPLDQIFDSVAAETSSLLDNMASTLLRYEPDDVAVVVASTNFLTPVGFRLPVDPSPPGDLAGIERAAVRAGSPAGTDVGAIAVPVTVEGRGWGALVVLAPGPSLPPGSKERLTPFTELTAVAIINAENKSRLTASRARVIATADETRRRVQRDVHDGAQQRLVHTIIVLKMARDAARAGDLPTDLLDEALSNAERASKELRDIVRGILPASLTRGGLRSGLESLLGDLALPVGLTVSAPRLSPQIETTAYFIIAEAITNVVKHAHAHRATVHVSVDGPTLLIEVRDDGRGGADARQGTGLTGLLDRVEAANGTLTVTGGPGDGTAVRATLPLDEQLSGLPAP